MKEFDFTEHARQGHSSEKTYWLMENWDKPITEEQFVKEWKALKKYSKCKTKKTFHHKYTPCSLRREYRALRSKFGFFPKKD